MHAATRMARAAVPVLDSAFAKNLPKAPLRESRDGFSFQYRRTEKGLSVTVQRGASQAEGVIEWVLGAGAQGETPLVSFPDGMHESRVSYFPQLGRYGVTVGQDAGASPGLEAALGLKKKDGDLRECVGCHTSAISRDLQPAIPGVQCISCHPGSPAHPLGGGRLNPGKLTAAEQVRQCGDCHRNEPLVEQTQLENLRFQPVRLTRSRCYRSGALTCTTCHDAHQDARRNDAAYYNAKCHACHDRSALHSDARNRGDCIGCHMPYVELHPALRFTDHFIRVVRPGDLPASIIRKRPADPAPARATASPAP